MNFKYIFLLIILILTSCLTKKTTINNDVQLGEVIVEKNNDKPEITDNIESKSKNAILKSELIKNYKSSNTIYHDLIHTKLDISFDYKNKHVFGIAEITLKPYYYSTDTLILDAQGFDIHSIEILIDHKSFPLNYSYDNFKIKINLDRKYKKDENYTIKIKYTAKPEELKSQGSWAIRSNKGLYFIDSDTDNPQIWTQGETQSSSAWFPTIDSPNQNMSQEIFLTVDKKFKTLSNGNLISSLVNNDGTRTDHWKQVKPHAPYLAMIAVGEFEVLEDHWRDLPVFVYVEKGDEKKAEELFKKTYKMIEFYSQKLDYDFPWDKYAQVVVRNFVSGAMENTGAVVFGDFVLNFTNEEQRIYYECVVAHELSHHWFGDLVTCESWANLPLNESFATYFEYLWLEHEYDRVVADVHLEKDYTNYTFERYFKDENLIRFYHKHRDNMFDAHSYQKGGLILHMLRYTVGDEAFWDALKLYLKQNEYKPVEIHNLRLAFEEITGQDLNWFFDQWFLNKGIPELNITYSYDESLKKAIIVVEQTQDLKKFPLYKIPTFVDIYLKNKVIRKKIQLDDQKEILEFNSSEKPLFMNFDPDNSILCKKTENYTKDEYIEILDRSPLYDDKNQALKNLKDFSNIRLNTVYIKLAKHVYWKFRYEALNRLQITNSDKIYNEYLKLLEDLSTNDENLGVRKLADTKLDKTKNKTETPIKTSNN